MKQTLLSVAAAALVCVVSVHAAELPKALVDSYLRVQTALAADTFDGIAAQAAAIETAAAALGKDAEKLVEAAKKLAAAKDIAAARTAFGDVSDALVAYADKTKSELGPGVRVAYCPMVNKPWLQKDKEIRNPYYGSSMLTCGSFRTKN
jgi:nucleotide-binding universal stress UspA family protein